MKKLLFLNFLAAALIATGCSSDDSNDPVNEETQCELAMEATAIAAVNYSNATAENHAQTCNAYKVALQNQIEACGDENGALQAIINGLGDCTAPAEVDGTLTVTAGSMPMNFTDLNVVKQNGLVKVSGASATGTYTIYFEVAENATGADILQNFEIKLVSVHHPYEGFTSNVTVNTDGTLTGTFHGIVVNDDNGMVELTSGNFNLEY